MFTDIVERINFAFRNDKLSISTEVLAIDVCFATADSARDF